MRALVAESNVVTRAVLRPILERAGFAVEELRDELAAACLLHKPGAPELALLAVDTMLADFGQVCAVMRGAKPGVYIVALVPEIVALVPEVRRIHVSTVLDAGADDFLIKPVSLHESEARIRVIGRRLAERGSDEPRKRAPSAAETTEKRERVALEKVIIKRPDVLRTLKSLLDDVMSTDVLAGVFEQMGLAPVVMLLRAGTILSDVYIREIQAFIHSKNLSEKLEVFRPPAGTAAFLNAVNVDVTA